MVQKSLNKYLKCQLTALTFACLSLAPNLVLANQNGHDFKALNPTPAGIDFLTIHSSRTLGHGRFNLGLFTTYSTNTMPIIEVVDGKQTRENIDDTVIHFDASVAVGLGDFFELGLTSSAIANAEAVSSDYRGEILATGLTELRPTLKASFVQERTWGLALIVSSSFNQMKNNPYLGNQGGPITSTEMALDVRFGKSVLAFNAGYKVRQTGDPVLALTALEEELPAEEKNGEQPIEPISDQGLWSVGYLQEFTKKRTHAFSLEFYGSKNFQESIDLSDRNQDQAEGLVDYRYRPIQDLDLHVGIASELSHGITSADWRVVGGLNYKFPGKPQPKKKKKVVKRRKVKRLPPPKPTQLAHLPKPVKMKPGKPILPPKFEVLVVNDVLFPFDSSQLLLHKAKNSKLVELADYLKLPPGLKKLEIIGHTCSMGSHAYNAGLSMRRANSIKNWLVATYGFSPHIIHISGKGETSPTVSNATEDGRKRNRRVEFRIYR